MRSQAQLSRTPAEWQEYQAAERKATLRELRRDLEQARDERPDWLVWIDARADGIHLHELRREDGSRVACPVPGCSAVRDDAAAPAARAVLERPAEPAQLTL